MAIHVLFIVGIIITIIGWLFDRAKSFNWLMSTIAPDYISAKQALYDLRQNAKIGLTPNHKGFSVLIEKWPNLEKRDTVQFIARSVAFVQFGPTVSNDIQLIARDKDQNEIQERWNMSEASIAIENIVEKKLFLIGSILFWFGILVSISSHLISSCTD